MIGRIGCRLQCVGSGLQCGSGTLSGVSEGRYRLVKQIGRGGMAEVIEAVAVGDHGFERRVAIKRLLANTGEDADRYRRMFLDEARIASQLHHANIVAVIDFGIGDGMPFQVLEHIDGIDVHSLLKRANGRVPIPIALYICIMVGHALDYAHAAEDADGVPLGIVHRDVTPANILVAWTGDIKLTDFGIAFAHERAERTMAGSTKGTPLFMAPEQMLGEKMDRRTDLFSLGCVLHTMVVGHSPLSVGDQRFHVASGGELELDANLPAVLRPIIERATRHDRRDRYNSAGELVAALASLLATYAIADSRSAVRDWLRELRGSAPVIAAAQPARGKLDALIELDLVLADASDGVRSFHSIPAATRVERPAPTNSAALRTTEPELSARLQPETTERIIPRHEPPARENPTKSRWPIVALLIGLIVVGVSVFVVARSASTGTDAGAPVVVAIPPLADTASPALPAADVDAAIANDAGAVDAAIPVDAATLNATPLDAARPRTAEPPVTAGDPNGTAQWRGNHHKSAAAFDAWTTSFPEAAGALYDWDAKTGRGRDLLSWLHSGRDTTVDGYLAAKPQRALAALVTQQPVAFTKLAHWVHAWPKQVNSLLRLGGGLPWTSRP